MQLEKLPLYLSNDEWFTDDREYGFTIPSAKCPASGIKEFNELRALLIGWHEKKPIPEEMDPYISIENFVQMRNSIGYSADNIKKEINLIYTKEEVEQYYQDN